MATITVIVSGETVGDVTITETIEGTNSERFLAWLTATYGKDAQGNQRTAAQCVEALWTSIRTGIFASIERHDADLAMEAARAAILPVESVTEVS